MKEKFIPKVGEQLYLSQRTGKYWVDMVKRPYTVIKVSPREVHVQACKLLFVGPRYFDSIADVIQEDREGEILVLHWAPKKGRWQRALYSGDPYPLFAFFGHWEHQPYLN